MQNADSLGVYNYLPRTAGVVFLFRTHPSIGGVITAATRYEMTSV